MRKGEKTGIKQGGRDRENNCNKVKDEETSAQQVRGFRGRRGWGVGARENRGGLKSSLDAQREETLKMTQFITITATKEWEGRKMKGRDASEQDTYCNTLARMEQVY